MKNTNSRQDLESELTRRLASALTVLAMGNMYPHLTRGIAMIVSTARQLLGKEQVDAEINENWSQVEAMQKGLCPICKKEPALSPEMCFCEKCQREGELEYAQFLLDIFDDQGYPKQ